jgi:5-formyltetrahydrofolate cyclo-ligase
LRAYRAASCIAVYLSFDGEVDLSELMKQATGSGKTIVLPVVQKGPGSRMCFRRYRLGDPVRRSRFGIREPCLSDRRRIRPSRIGLVLMPVVGFDRSGTRLGMGGGFYDRYFARLAGRPGLHNRLVGVAFECQKVKSLQRHAWDIPMTAVVTETRVYRNAGTPDNKDPVG